MLATGAECEPGEERLLDLNRAAQAAWPAFAAELLAVTGVDVEYRDEGTLVVAPTRDDLAQLRFSYEFQRSLDIPLEWLSVAEARRLEPHLKPGIAGAVLSRGDHQVENRRLAEALRLAFLAAGGRLHEARPVRAVEVSGGRVEGLWLEGALGGDRPQPAEVVVLAAGAWCRNIEGLPPAAQPPVRPVKGQVLTLLMDPQAPLLSHVLWAPKIYLVPRRDGRLIIGATVEEQGFDESLTAGGVFSLLEAAWRAVPAIEELPIAETMVGFRPTSRDDAPILGASSVEGLVIASGHHRNGILLAPITADAVSQLILSGRVPPLIAGFGLDRFQAAINGVAAQ